MRALQKREARKQMGSLKKALSAAVLAAGLAVLPSCKTKEQPKKSVPVECKPCARPKPCAECKPCPKPIDQSKLPHRFIGMSIKEGEPLEITNLKLFLQKAAEAERKGEKTFSPRGTSLILGNVTKIDDRGFDLSLNLKPSRKVWVKFYQPQCIAFGPFSIAVYATRAQSKKEGPQIIIVYPEALIHLPNKAK